MTQQQKPLKILLVVFSAMLAFAMDGCDAALPSADTSTTSTVNPPSTSSSASTDPMPAAGVAEGPSVSLSSDGSLAGQPVACATDGTCQSTVVF